MRKIILFVLSLFSALLILSSSYAGDLSKASLDKLILNYLERDPYLIEIFQVTKVNLEDYTYQGKVIDVILGEYWDDEHSFLFLAHDVSRGGYNQLGFILFPGRSKNLKPMMPGDINQAYTVDFDLSCLKGKSCPVKQFNSLLWKFLGRGLGFGNRNVYDKANDNNMQRKVDYGQVYLYTFKIKECPPDACMDTFYTFIKKNGKVLGSRMTTVGYKPPF